MSRKCIKKYVHFSILVKKMKYNILTKKSNRILQIFSCIGHILYMHGLAGGVLVSAIIMQVLLWLETSPHFKETGNETYLFTLTCTYISMSPYKIFHTYKCNKLHILLHRFHMLFLQNQNIHQQYSKFHIQNQSFQMRNILHSKKEEKAYCICFLTQMTFLDLLYVNYHRKPIRFLSNITTTV